MYMSPLEDRPVLNLETRKVVKIRDFYVVLFTLLSSSAPDLIPKLRILNWTNQYISPKLCTMTQEKVKMRAAPAMPLTFHGTEH